MKFKRRPPAVDQTAMARALELVALMLRGEHRKAEVLLDTVPTAEQRAVSVAALAFTATALEETYGRVMAQLMVGQMQDQEVRHG